MIKIEIEWTSSISASLKIQGRELRVEIYPQSGETRLEGIKDPETSETFGGILATELFGLIGDAMQAQCIAEEDVDRSGETDVTWQRLSRGAAQEVVDRFF